MKGAIIESKLYQLYDSIVSSAIARKPPYCGVESNYSLRLLDSRTVFSTAPSFVYFRIPKAANTTVLAALLLNTYSDYDESESPRKYLRSRFGTLKQAGANWINESFVFSFARNPADRLLSAYADKIVKNKKPKILVNRFFGRPDNSQDHVSVSEFLEYLIGTDPKNYDPHWARQRDLIPVDISRLSYLGKVESISEDLPKVMNSIFGDDSKVRLPLRSHMAGDSKRYTLSAKERQLIFNIYRDDYEAFGYGYD